MDVKRWWIWTVVLGALTKAVGRKAVIGYWGPWSAWSGCSASCGSGKTSRTAKWIMNKIATPYLFYDIMECSGPVRCPEDGHWGYWTMWSTCTVMCGGGKQSRQRRCNSPKPTFGGRDCTGEFKEDRICHNATCPVIPRDFDINECTEEMLMCDSGEYCVSRDSKCDGTLDCDDGSDEETCVPSFDSMKFAGNGCVKLRSIVPVVTLFIAIWISWIIYNKQLI